jgi:Ni/Fe-hydrogenase subunit HybB-like protein
MSHHEEFAPVGGRVATLPVRLLAALFGVTVAIVLWRFWVGLGPSTALSDGYPWGTWKVFNVIVLTALGSGGYATALLVYALNRWRYHPLIRMALLTSVLGYTTGIVALGVDIGRPWNFWRLAIFPGWNLHSVLLEVAVCITIYVLFLWIEAAPPFLETWAKGPHGRLRSFALRVTPPLEKAFPWILAMAVVLPTMHQSSLGSLFILAGYKVHPLWQTPLVPLLFLVSCWALGIAAVIGVSLLSSLAWDRPLFLDVLRPLARVMSWLLLALVALRFADVIWRGQFPRAFAFDFFSILFWAEAALLTAPALAILVRRSIKAGPLLRAAIGAAVGGGLYRLDAALISYQPPGKWTYFPSLPELIVALGFMGLAVLAYIYIVKKFPILTAPHAARS